jgi:acyl carrier protein
MFTSKNIISLIQESLDGLYNSSMIDSKIFVSEETELFGGQSNIDSMCFVALITDVEDRLCRLTEKDIFIVLSDIEELYPDSPVLTVGLLINYLKALNNA